MTTYSSTDLATRILKDLGLLGAEENPSSADLAWATQTAESEIAMMAALRLPIWNGSDMAVPVEYLTTLSRRIGLAVAPSFGLVDLANAQLAMREAERPLTLLSAPRSSPRLMRSDDGAPARARFNFSTGQ